MSNEDWGKICEIFPNRSYLLARLMPILVEHLNRKEESLKNQQLEILKRKFPKNGFEVINSTISEIFWFTHLINKGWDVTIKSKGPDCFGKVNKKEVYFEIISPTGLDEIEKRCLTLGVDLGNMKLSKKFLIAIQYVDPKFDKDLREKIKNKIKEIDLCSPCCDRFYLLMKKEENNPFEIKENEINGYQRYCYVILFERADKYGIKNHLELEDKDYIIINPPAYRPEAEFIEWLEGRLEDKLKKQMIEKRENYLVIDVPLGYGSSPISGFKKLTENVKRYNERLYWVYGLFILKRWFENKNCHYSIELKPNPIVENKVADSIMALCEKSSIKL